MHILILKFLKDCKNILLLNNTIYIASQHGASDSIAYFSALSNPADTQSVSCLGLCGRDICPKSYAWYGLGTLNP